MAVFQKGNKASHKVTPGLVQDIRMKYKTGRITQGALAKEYKLSVVQIGRIVRGEVWMDVPEDLSENEKVAMAQRLMQVQESASGLARLQALAKEQLGADAAVEELRDDSAAKARGYLD